MAKPAFVDRLISKIPMELHIPGMQFCGPNTRLQERLRAGQRGINKLDAECLKHDILYAQTNNPDKRRIGDRELIEFAKKRYRAKDASIKEKIAAKIVSSALTLKGKVGMGLKKARKKTKKGGFLSPAILAGIGAAATILQSGSNLYKNYKDLQQRKKKVVGGNLKKRTKRGSGYFLKPYDEAKKPKRIGQGLKKKKKKSKKKKKN